MFATKELAIINNGLALKKGLINYCGNTTLLMT